MGTPGTAAQATQRSLTQTFASDGRIDAAELLQEAAQRHDIRLETLVAETALWANPEVHRRLLAKGSKAYSLISGGIGQVRRNPGTRLGSLTLDDNSCANRAIKLALGISPHNLVGFETAHIWPRTCYDEGCHTAVANLVLLPPGL